SRDAERRATGHGKWRAMAAASWRALRRFPLVSVHVRTPAGTVSARTPFVFVGNNAYRLGPRALGTRERLDAGRLCVYTMRCQSRLAMAWLVLRAIVQRVESIDALEVAEVDTADVVLWRRRIDVALDGEVVAMATPLRYRVRPRALAVIRPPAVATADAAQPVAAARPSPAGPPEAAA
ncbi:MAG TPA: hypothetical protein VHE35_33950, partial [Kofleriaceae bacterium]|nr:hypothetical protein [Kofleriaceae bacterium]